MLQMLGEKIYENFTSIKRRRFAKVKKNELRKSSEQVDVAEGCNILPYCRQLERVAKPNLEMKRKNAILLIQ